ncbi:protein xylosyltransferase [Aureococcus anophagefferens]|nr:protein xylosyltransferase [Aureococcus anophagefferens]
MAAQEQAPCSPAAARSTNFPLPLPARFLDASEAVGETVVLASYPRSGNSLLRSLLESISGVVTGSDTAPNRTLSLALQECGVRGEGVIDERTWVVKSHYPERRAALRRRNAILLVRNPWDVIDSYFNMTLTNSHNTTMRDDQYARFEELFRGLARAEADVWARFNRWWLRAPIPLLVVRYEDLVHHRHRTLRRVAWFLRGCDPLEGTGWADRVGAGVRRWSDAWRAAPRRRAARRVVAAAFR